MKLSIPKVFLVVSLSFAAFDEAFASASKKKEKEKANGKEFTEFWDHFFGGDGGSMSMASFPSAAPSNAPTGSFRPSVAPSNAPTASFFPTPAPTGCPEGSQDCLVNLDDLDVAFERLFERVADFRMNDVLNEMIPLVGSSLNSVIGGPGGGSIDAVLDLRSFVEAASLPDVVTCERLECELNLALAGDGASSPCKEKEGPVVVRQNGTITEIDFCSVIEFERTTALSGSGLFEAVGECIELETTANEVVSSSLTFAASIKVDPIVPSDPTVILDSIEVDVAVDNMSDLTLFLGMLSLDCKPNTASASATYILTFCETDCDDRDIGRQIEDGSSFYLVRTGSYEIEGVCNLGDDFPGVEFSGEGSPESTVFKITEDKIYSSTGQVDVPGLELDDFLIFCPYHALSLLRAMDTTFSRTQKNEAMQLGLPLTNITYSETLRTGPIIVSHLFPLFLKVQDFNKRPSGTLFLIGLDAFDATSIDLTKEEIALEFYFVEAELTVSPDDDNAIRDLAKEVGGVCTFQLPQDPPKSPTTSSEFAGMLRASISDCNVTVCGSCAFDSDADEYSGCGDCDVVIDSDEEDRVFIASVAYSNDQPGEPKDVQLMGLYEALGESEGRTLRRTSLFGLPLNQPVTPALVPRFRTFYDLATRIVEAVKRSGYENNIVNFSYKPETSAVDQPSRFDVSLFFDRDASFDIRFDTSARVGELENIRRVVSVEESSTIVLVEAEYAADFAVVLAPDESEGIMILGNACKDMEIGTTCDLNGTTLLLEYVIADTPNTVTLKLPSKVDASPREELMKALNLSGMGDLATVKQQPNGSKLFAVAFDPSISSVRLWNQKDCLDLESNVTFTVRKGVFVCRKEDEMPIYDVGNYGLNDEDLLKRPFQITVQQASIEARFEVNGQEDLVATVGPGFVELEIDLDLSLKGNLSLSVGSGDFLPFSDWLITVASILEPDNEAFWSASSIFEATALDGNVGLAPPFDDFGSKTTRGSFENGPFAVNFANKNNAPSVLFSIALPGGIPKLSFAHAVNSLSRAVGFVVGDGEPQSVVESCSSGLLGIDKVAYMIPCKYSKKSQSAKMMV